MKNIFNQSKTNHFNNAMNKNQRISCLHYIYLCNSVQLIIFQGEHHFFARFIEAAQKCPVLKRTPGEEEDPKSHFYALTGLSFAKL